VRSSKPSDYVAIPFLRIAILLASEREAPKAIHKSSVEIIIRQITFESDMLFSVAIEQEHRRSPDCTKAVEPGRVFLYVSFDRKEVVVDELGSFLV
jgi:hypothetical protein